MSVLGGVDLLVAIDDTDDLRSLGTGRVCRLLLAELAAAGFGTPAGATRHQLLRDPRIPYTSHNSSACLAWRSAPGGPEAVLPGLVEYAGRFLERVCPQAADPGLAVAVPAGLAAPADLVAFGRRAQREVVDIAEACALAATAGVHLSGHGGSDGGRIGALAAIGLHLSGADGFFLWSPGLRRLDGHATLAELRGRGGIDVAVDPAGREPGADEPIDLGDWVRPVLRDGRAVLLLDPPTVAADGTTAWRTAPRYVVHGH